MSCDNESPARIQSLKEAKGFSNPQSKKPYDPSAIAEVGYAMALAWTCQLQPFPAALTSGFLPTMDASSSSSASDLKVESCQTNNSGITCGLND